MAFNYNAAIQAGYTPEEIDQFLSQQNGAQKPSPQTPGWASLLKSIGLGVIPDGIGGIENIPNQINYMSNKSAPNAKQNYISGMRQNPLLNQQAITQGAGGNTSGMMGTVAKQAGQDVAGEASYMVPFGKGANIATKALLPGFTSGTLQGLSNPGATPVSVGVNAATGTGGGAIGHGIGALIGKAAGVLPKLGNTIANQADPILRSQYNVPRTISKDISLPEATQFLAQNYGIANKDQAVKTASNFIPLMTAIRNQALSKLPATDLGNIDDVVNSSLQPATLVSDTAKNNFLNHIKSTLGYANDGTQIVNSNPQKVMYGISQLENLGHMLGQSKDPAANQLSSAYKTVARTMEDRLGNGYENPDNKMVTEGINGVPIKDLLTQPNEAGVTPLEQIHAMNPKLGMHIENNVETLRDLRHSEAPFVAISRAAQAAEDVNKHNVVSPFDLGSSLFLMHYNPWLGLGAMAARGALNSNMSKTAIGKGAMYSGKALQSAPSILNPLLQNILSAAGGRAASATTNTLNQ